MKNRLTNSVLKKIYRLLALVAHFRGKFLGLFLKSIGEDVAIQSNCRFARPTTMEIGHHVFINFGVNFLNSDKAGIKIGNFVAIGPQCLFITTNKNYAEWTRPLFGTNNDIHKPIIISDDVWIGANVTVLPGVKIGRGAIVGAGAVVTKDIPPYAVAAGVPARIIKYRFDKSLVEKASAVDLFKAYAAGKKINNI